MTSRLGWSGLGCTWKVVDLWTVPAEDLLRAADVGVVPWVPLARYDGPPAELLEQCRERIEREAGPGDRDNLLAVSQVLAQLRFPQLEMLALLGGKGTMIESPLIQGLIAETLQTAILNLLKARFTRVPNDVRRLLKEIMDEKTLQKLNVHAGRAESMEAFKEELLK